MTNEIARQLLDAAPPNELRCTQSNGRRRDPRCFHPRLVARDFHTTHGAESGLG
jgi:hypothetical protein